VRPCSVDVASACPPTPTGEPDPISLPLTLTLIQTSARDALPADADELPYSPHGTPFVDGGLTAAVSPDTHALALMRAETMALRGGPST
jgi:hypothetical protein